MSSKQHCCLCDSATVSVEGKAGLKQQQDRQPCHGSSFDRLSRQLQAAWCTLETFSAPYVRWCCWDEFTFDHQLQLAGTCQDRHEIQICHAKVTIFVSIMTLLQHRGVLTQSAILYCHGYLYKWPSQLAWQHLIQFEVCNMPQHTAVTRVGCQYVCVYNYM